MTDLSVANNTQSMAFGDFDNDIDMLSKKRESDLSHFSWLPRGPPLNRCIPPFQQQRPN